MPRVRARRNWFIQSFSRLFPISRDNEITQHRKNRDRVDLSVDMCAFGVAVIERDQNRFWRSGPDTNVITLSRGQWSVTDLQQLVVANKYAIKYVKVLHRK